MQAPSSPLPGSIPASVQAGLILSQVKVAHYIRGRVRVICARLKQDDQLYQSVCSTLDTLPEISTWKINRTTGSVTISYQPEKIISGSFVDRLIRGAAAKYAKNH